MAGLQLSVPGAPHEAVQARLPEPVHSKPSSTCPLQVSSTPLHVSVAGGVHAPHVHESPHTLLPVEPQIVVQLAVSPSWHSTAPPTSSSGLSSTPARSPVRDLA